jgi:hypothetical protein
MRVTRRLPNLSSVRQAKLQREEEKGIELGSVKVQSGKGLVGGSVQGKGTGRRERKAENVSVILVWRQGLRRRGGHSQVGSSDDESRSGRVVESSSSKEGRRVVEERVEATTLELRTSIERLGR